VKYFIKRMIRGVLLLIAISICSFVLFEAVPGDFFSEARLNPGISPATLETLRSDYALDRSLWSKYTSWLTSILRGEWGMSIATNAPVAKLLRIRSQNTLLLTIPATLLAWLIAIPIGIWSASTRNKAGTLFVSGGISLLISMPDILIIVGLMALAARMNFPLGGMISAGYSHMNGWEKLHDALAHFALPVAALVIVALPPLVAHAKAALEDVLEMPFIRAAKGSGIPRRRVLYRHALPAAANSLISLLGLSIGALLSSSLLVEVTMGWPGVGQLLLEAIFQRDYYVVIGSVMISTIFLIVGNLFSDMLLYAVDPRIRQG
jgi:peptide/nickel transport system permease protein